MRTASDPSWRLIAIVVLVLSIIMVGGIAALRWPEEEPFSSDEPDMDIDVTSQMTNVCNKDVGLSAAAETRNGVQDCHLNLRHQIISDKVTLDSKMQVEGKVLLNNVDLRTHAKKVLEQQNELTRIEDDTKPMNVGSRTQS